MDRPTDRQTDREREREGEFPSALSLHQPHLQALANFDVAAEIWPQLCTQNTHYTHYKDGRHTVTRRSGYCDWVTTLVMGLSPTQPTDSSSPSSCTSSLFPARSCVRGVSTLRDGAPPGADKRPMALPSPPSAGNPVLGQWPCGWWNCESVLQTKWS